MDRPNNEQLYNCGYRQEAQLPQRNSASASHSTYNHVGWLTDGAMHKTPQNRRCCTTWL